MRRIALVIAILSCVVLSGAGPKTVYVKGYTRKDGTYVQPHYRSPPGGGALPVVPAAAPTPLLPAPARTEPRTDATATPRTDPRVAARTAAPAPTPARAPLPPESPEEERERRAGYKLRTAKVLLAQGTADSRQRGVDTLHDLVDQYPETRAAEEGRQLLAANRNR